MAIAYLFESTTRAPAGLKTCQVDPKSGQDLWPVNSLKTPPPDYPEFVSVRAGNSEWKVDFLGTKIRLLEDVKHLHARKLRVLTDQASAPERDTWFAKLQAAQAIKSETATVEQHDMLSAEAQARGVELSDLVNLILEKSAAYHRAIGEAAVIKNTLKNLVEKADNLDALVSAGVEVRLALETSDQVMSSDQVDL
jgi:hypothetical protein